MSAKNYLGENLKSYRKFMSIYQAELGERLNTPQNFISLYETGSVMPSSERLCRMSNALGVSVNMLLMERIDWEKIKTPDNTISQNDNEENDEDMER